MHTPAHHPATPQELEEKNAELREKARREMSSVTSDFERKMEEAKAEIVEEYKGKVKKSLKAAEKKAAAKYAMLAEDYNNLDEEHSVVQKRTKAKVRKLEQETVQNLALNQKNTEELELKRAESKALADELTQKQVECSRLTVGARAHHTHTHTHTHTRAYVSAWSCGRVPARGPARPRHTPPARHPPGPCFAPSSLTARRAHRGHGWCRAAQQAKLDAVTAQARSKFSHLQGEADLASTQVEEMEDQVKQLTVDLKASKKKVKANKEKHAKAKTEWEVTQDKLQQSVATLELDKSTLEQEMEESRKKVKALCMEVSELKAAVAQGTTSSGKQNVHLNTLKKDMSETQANLTEALDMVAAASIAKTKAEAAEAAAHEKAAKAGVGASQATALLSTCRFQMHSLNSRMGSLDAGLLDVAKLLDIKLGAGVHALDTTALSTTTVDDDDDSDGGGEISKSEGEGEREDEGEGEEGGGRGGDMDGEGGGAEAEVQTSAQDIMPIVQKELDTMQDLACTIHEAVAKLKPKAASVKETSLDLNRQHNLALGRVDSLTKELEREVTELRQKQAELKAQQQRSEETEKALNTKTEEFSDLESKFLTTGRDLEATAAKLEGTEASLAAVTEQGEKLTEELSASQERCAQLEGDLANAKEKMVEADELLGAIEEQYTLVEDASFKTLKHLDTTRESLRVSQEIYTATQEELDVEKPERMRLEGECANHLQALLEVPILRENLEESSSFVNSLTVQLSELQNKATALETECKEVTLERSSAEEKCGNLGVSLKASEQKVENVTIRLGTVTAELEQGQDELDALRPKLAAAVEEAAGLTEALAAANAKVASTQDSLDDQTGHMVQMEASLDGKVKEVFGLEKTVAELTLAQAQLTERLELSRTALDEARVSAAAAKDKLDASDANLTKAKDTLRLRKDTQESLGQTQQELAERSEALTKTRVELAAVQATLDDKSRRLAAAERLVAQVSGEKFRYKALLSDSQAQAEALATSKAEAEEGLTSTQEQLVTMTATDEQVQAHVKEIEALRAKLAESVQKVATAEKLVAAISVDKFRIKAMLGDSEAKIQEGAQERAQESAP